MLALGIFLAAVLIATAAVAGCFFATRRQVRRVAAEREEEFRALFASEPPSDPSIKVEVLLQSGSRRRASYWPPLGWIDSETLEPIENSVVGWRVPPFAEEDVSEWSRDRIEAELERLFPRRRH